MQSIVIRVSDRFHKLLFQQEGVEPLLIADRAANYAPRRIFSVWYVLGESGGSLRPIFKNELTGCDYELQILYPTQRTDLEGLQSVMEPSRYGSPRARLSSACAQNISTGERRTVKILLCEALVLELVSGEFGGRGFRWINTRAVIYRPTHKTKPTSAFQFESR